MSDEALASNIQKPRLQHWLAVILMVACTLFAWGLTPHEKWFEHLGEPQFEQIIPKSFADWTLVSDENNTLIVDPEQRETLNDIYTQTVSRTYVQQSTGRRLMLSLAYGDNQTYSKRMHFPEVCYHAQGFNVLSVRNERVLAKGHEIEVKRMTAQMGDRVEQVSYFIRIGDHVLSNRISLSRIFMGLKGYIADGLLFRVSEISDQPVFSHQLQDQFINDLLNTLSPSEQAVLIGSN
jgi:EpsI family protein